MTSHKTGPGRVTKMPSNGQYAIETAGLTKRFGKLAAVNDLDLRVPAGSVFAFLGRNGAGKRKPLTCWATA